MTDVEIKNLIDILNKHESSELIFRRPINNNVEVAMVWYKEPIITDDIGGFCSNRFFFIKDELNKYVGAVFDMNRDLHWYILEESRKKGYLTKALNQSILPYLFDDGRETQRITIDQDLEDNNYSNSKRVALNLGFKPIDIDETEFELVSDEFNWEFENLMEVDTELPSDRIKILSKRVEFAYKSLRKISEELLMAYGDDKGLLETANEVQKYTLLVEDLEWESKNDMY